MNDDNGVSAVLIFADRTTRELVVAKGTTEVRLPFQRPLSLRDEGGPLWQLLKRPPETIFLFEYFDTDGTAVFYESGAAS